MEVRVKTRSRVAQVVQCFVYRSSVEYAGKFDYRLCRGASPGVSPTDYEVALVGLANVFSFEGGALELNLDPDLMSVLDPTDFLQSNDAISATMATITERSPISTKTPPYVL